MAANASGYGVTVREEAVLRDLVARARLPRTTVGCCAECGTEWDNTTSGCNTCHDRSSARKQREKFRKFTRAYDTCRCGVGWADRTPGCDSCRSRHFRRQSRGTAFVKADTASRSCGCCGCGLDERTRGCSACRKRHYRRGLRQVSCPANGNGSSRLAPGSLSDATPDETHSQMEVWNGQ